LALNRKVDFDGKVEYPLIINNTEKKVMGVYPPHPTAV